MFADDTILFFHAKVEKVRNIMKCFELDQEWSGQRINASKSGIIYLDNCVDETRWLLNGTLEMKLCGYSMASWRLDGEIHLQSGPGYLD